MRSDVRPSRRPLLVVHIIYRVLERRMSIFTQIGSRNGSRTLPHLVRECTGRADRSRREQSRSIRRDGSVSRSDGRAVCRTPGAFVNCPRFFTDLRLPKLDPTTH